MFEIVKSPSIPKDVAIIANDKGKQILLKKLNEYMENGTISNLTESEQKNLIMLRIK